MGCLHDEPLKMRSRGVHVTSVSDSTQDPKKDGSYVIVEVKGENKIDDAIVQAKARSAAQLASANAMTYEMIPGMKASYGLHQPALGLPLECPCQTSSS